MGGHGGRGGLFCSGLCASVSVSAFGLLPRQHALRCCLACTGSPLAATGPGGSPASIGPSPWMLPTADVAFVPLALGFQTFPHSALTSLTHRAPRAFRCHRQDFNATVWQVSARPSSLTPVGGWLAQRRLHSAACAAGGQDSGCLVWSPGTLLCSSHPVLQGEVSLQVPRAPVVRQTQPGMACQSPWCHGMVLGPCVALERLEEPAVAEGNSPAHPEVCEAGLWHPWARCLRGDPA